MTKTRMAIWSSGFTLLLFLTGMPKDRRLLSQHPIQNRGLAHGIKPDCQHPILRHSKDAFKQDPFLISETATSLLPNQLSKEQAKQPKSPLAYFPLV